MPKVSLRCVEQAAAVTQHGGTGAIETRALFDRECDPIHLHVHKLSSEASMNISGHPTDCLIYVWEGVIETGGARLDSRSSAIAEYGTTLHMTAGLEGATILAFRLKERGQQERAGGHVHALPSARVPHADNVQGKRVTLALHADSQCATCTLWMHENDYDGEQETAVHSHSQDEIIFVRAGHIRLGNRVHGPGTALAITAHTKYSFFSGTGGLSIVNFRGSSPTYTSGDGSVVLDEAQLWHSHVGKPEYLEIV
jgi:hypothetical protein